MKKCVKCGVVKSVSEFGLNPGGTARVRCKHCVSEGAREASRRYRQTHQEATLEASREYHKTHLEARRKACRNWAEKNREYNHRRFRDWAVKNREKLQQKFRMKRFGVTEEQYQKLMQQQGGVCAICGESNQRLQALAVDHDHKSGKVRGLLCFLCNSVLGFAKDSPERLLEAALYLEHRSS